MRAQLIRPDDARWRHVLQGTSHDVYHLPGYGALYERDPRVEETALYVSGEQGELLLPLSLRPIPDHCDRSLIDARDASSPYGYPGPLLRGTLLPHELKQFRSVVRQVFVNHRIASCFVRTNPLLPGVDAPLAELGVAVEQGRVAIVELHHTEEEIWRGYDSEHRRNVERLREAGYSCRVDDWEDYDAFQALYAETMRRVSAASFYAFDREYFEGLRRLLGPRLHLFSIVSPSGEIVAAGLNTESCGLVNGHLCGTANSHVQRSPAKLFWDESWRWAKRNGHQYFNLGGGLGGKADSLFRFKKGFATTTRPFRTVRVVADEGLYQSACVSAGVEDERTQYFPSYRRPPTERRVQSASNA